jgi:hypothetical protein
MKRGKLGVVRGSGNVFRDLGHENADAEQFKAILAAEIIKALDRASDGAWGARAHRHCGGRLFAYTQCEPGAVYCRSPNVDHQPAGIAGGSEGPGAA